MYCASNTDCSRNTDKPSGKPHKEPSAHTKSLQDAKNIQGENRPPRIQGRQKAGLAGRLFLMIKNDAKNLFETYQNVSCGRKP